MDQAVKALRGLRVVLVEPSHPGNIGAVARAMRNMGLSELWLVAPRRFPDPECSARAAGADAVLDAARVVATLDAALADCVAVYGCSARERGIPMPTLEPRQAAAEIISTLPTGPVGLVFGRERTGLHNDEIARCRVQVAIPADPEFPSLNLAQAVQVLSYELRLAALDGRIEAAALEPPATAGELEGLFGHLAEALELFDFHKGRNPDAALTKLRRLFQRARLQAAEVRLLRGILAEAQYQIRTARGSPCP